MANPILWKGKQSFRVTGTGMHEDTLRIRSNYAKGENLYRLRLPTLCITYADMKFINDIGGKQLDWPDSAVYGPSYFDPPVEITNHQDIERLTWIRGAHRVLIGPQETEIEWYSFNELVIPRFRISKKSPTEVLLEVDSVTVEVKPQLQIDIVQYADGRSIGGVSVVKRHPDWKEPDQEKPQYKLRVRVLDFENGTPLVESQLTFFRWEGDRPSIKPMKGAFIPVEEAWTDGTGSVVFESRLAEELEAVTLAMEGWRATAKVWRAQANESVRLLMTAMKLKPARYPGKIDFSRKIYKAVYNLDERDTLDWVVKTFVYKNAEELVKLTRINMKALHGVMTLPGWYFIHAHGGDTLEKIADSFGLPKGWPRTVGRHHRPRPDIVIEHEIIAVPSPEFVREHKLR